MIQRMRRISEDRPVAVVSPTVGERRTGESRPAPSRAPGTRQGTSWSASNSIADLPIWVPGLIGSGVCRHRSVRIDGATHMSPIEFASETRRAYASILEGVDSDRLWRAWNFIPRINDDASDSSVPRDRYMAFNSGRHHGFADSYREDARYPVASGVGHAGDDLVIHLLHGDERPTLVDNPRQVPPDEYSSRFGHPPPVFARACRIELERAEALLVSGTASVVGEASLHGDDFAAQLDETLRNLEVVVAGAWPGRDLSVLGDWLVYLPDARFATQVEEAIAPLLPEDGPVVEIRQQPLCRPELLVEIECAGFIAGSGGGR